MAACRVRPSPGEILDVSCRECGHLNSLHVGCEECPVCRLEALLGETPKMTKTVVREPWAGALRLTMEIPGDEGWELWERLEKILHGHIGREDLVKVTVLGTEVGARLTGYWRTADR